MNVTGLNKLGLSQPANVAGGRASEKGDNTSFDDVMSKTEDSDRAGSGEAPPERVAPVVMRMSNARTGATHETPIPAKPLKVNESVMSDVESPGEVAETSDGQMLPAQPTAPTLGGPALNDRLMTGVVGVPLGAAASKQPALAGQDGEIDSLTRRAVWNGFLKKMKAEFGVTAEDVLNAFGSLSPEELAKPPAETVDKVVMALGLDGQQAQMARQYFMELIGKTQSRSLGEELSSSQKQISLTLMSQREMDRRHMSQSVDRIQQKFFMNGAYPRAPIAPPQSELPQQMATPAGAQVDSRPAEMETFQSALPVTDRPVARIAESVPRSGAMDSAMAEMTPVSAEDTPADVDGLLKKFEVANRAMPTGPSVEHGMKNAAMAAQADPAAVSNATATKVTDAAVMRMPQPGVIPAAQIGRGENRQDDMEYDEFTSDASYLGAAAGAEQGRNRVGADFQTQLNQAAGPQPAAPVQVSDLVQSAQVMVNSGGGEMKVTLAPEGLGEVAMRVSVRDGKVNVQMITESDEAKRLIERQLGDLKVSLASQHLNVDGIKVDTATNISKQMEQQYQDAQRQMAQQTLEQFRQDQQGWRRSFFETPALRVYKGQGEAPRDVQAPTASSRRTGNRRLDLVA